MAHFAWPRSLKGRLIVTYLFLILLSVGGLAGWMAPQLRKYAEEQAEHELEIEAHLAAIVLREHIEEVIEGKVEADSLRDLLHTYASAFNSRLRITVLNADLWVLSSTDPRVLTDREDRHPELLAASRRQEQHDIRLDEYSGEERIFAAAPVINDDDESPIAFIQVSFPTAPLWVDVRRTWATLFSVVAVVALVTLGSSLWLAQQVAAPLERLTALTRRLANGDLKGRARLQGPQEVRQLAEAFNEMAERLEQMLQRQRDFVANAAHELRSPLTSMRLRLELILTQMQDDPQAQRRYLEQILEEIDRLRRMTDQLLLLSSVEQGNRLPPVPTDLAPLLYELGEEMMPIFRARQQKFTLEVPPHLPNVVVNPEQVRIIVRNLLDNAAKYTQHGGQIELKAEDRGGYLVISVTDNGPGISDETLPHIFDRFYRGDKSRSRTAESGSGLGLSLVKELVTLNKGIIEVQSAAGKGSTFTVRFPLLEES
ncbi:MAG: HAMP domain-containing sensor histidine kinase [Anaerolineales bacterium]